MSKNPDYRNVIGIAAPEPGRQRFSYWFSQAVWQGLTDAADELGQDLLYFGRPEKDRSLQSCEAYLNQPVDGIVFIAPQNDTPGLKRLAARGLPFLVVAGNRNLPYPYVGIDNYEATQRALSFLRQLGHTRIAHIAGPQLRFDSQVREKAYLDFMREKGLDMPAGYLVRGGFSEDGGRVGAEALLKLQDRPTAIFCGNDTMAVGAMETAAKLGIRIPEDVSLVGFDNEPATALMTPSLTTVSQPGRELGEVALRTIVDLIRGRAMDTTKIIEADLIVRDSTGHWKSSFR